MKSNNANDCVKDLQRKTSDEERLERMVKDADPGRKGPILMDGTVGVGMERDDILRRQQGIKRFTAMFKVLKFWTLSLVLVACGSDYAYGFEFYGHCVYDETKYIEYAAIASTGDKVKSIAMLGQISNADVTDALSNGIQTIFISVAGDGIQNLNHFSEVFYGHYDRAVALLADEPNLYRDIYTYESLVDRNAQVKAAMPGVRTLINFPPPIEYPAPETWYRISDLVSTDVYNPCSRTFERILGQQVDRLKSKTTASVMLVARAFWNQGEPAGCQPTVSLSGIYERVAADKGAVGLLWWFYDAAFENMLGISSFQEVLQWQVL